MPNLDSKDGDNNSLQKEYGDFQTPLVLTEKVFSLLEESFYCDVSGFKTIIDPTCGIGNFLLSSNAHFHDKKIIGVEIRKKYCEIAKTRFRKKGKLVSENNNSIEIFHKDFFSINWEKFLSKYPKPILFIGNPPWITISEMRKINGFNLPKRENYKKAKGIDAITGKGDFDISENIITSLIRIIFERIFEFLKSQEKNKMRENHNSEKNINSISYFGDQLIFLCKESVARRILKFLGKKRFKENLPFLCRFYRIDAKKYFNVSVNAGIICFIPKLNKGSESNYFYCPIFELEEHNQKVDEIGLYKGKLISNVCLFRKWHHLIRDQKMDPIWRSGIKHDCSKVFELIREGNHYKNGYGREFKIEDDFCYPLLKSSDLSNNKIKKNRKVMLVPQRRIGEETFHIKQDAPLTWGYLNFYSDELASRGSKIYQNNPRFSIFGVGPYSFKPWKIAISGFYHSLDFRLVGSIGEKPVILDDTCYFLAFNCFERAVVYHNLLNHPICKEFYQSFIFWNTKRPITKSILKKIDFRSLINEIGKENIMDSVLKSNPELLKKTISKEINSLLKKCKA